MSTIVEPVAAETLSAGLPFPVARWLEAAWPGGIDRTDTLLLEGPVRIVRAGIRLRGHCTMRFELGRGYVSDIRIGVGPIVAMQGLDALVDGTGVTVVGREASIGDEIDQGAFLALWAMSVLHPGAWPLAAGLAWTPDTDRAAAVELPFGGGTEHVVLHFDSDESPFPTAFEADRYRVVGGPRVAWGVEYDEWHWWDGVAIPTRLRVRWADELRPWFSMRVENAVPNEPMGDAFDRARQVLRAVRAAVEQTKGRSPA